MSRHLHFYFSEWVNESRAWRAGTLALERGYATAVDYIGHKADSLPDQQQIADGQRILRLGAKPAPPGSARIVRALALPRWWRACLQGAKIDDASLVVAHSLAALPVAVRLAHKHRLPLLYDAHELETERAGWSKSIRKFARVVESRLIRKCDHVVLVNDSIRDWYLDVYPRIDASVVRNVPVLPDRIGDSTLRQTFGITDNALVFVYCGALGRERCLSELIAAFNGLRPDRHLVIIGRGPEKEALMAQGRGLENVHFHDTVPQIELITLLSGADVGVNVPCIDALSYKFALSNKIFEYAAARLGMILWSGPETNRFMAEYPAAKHARPSVDSLRAVIKSWTRQELRDLAPAMAAYKPPSWQKEQSRLVVALDRALKNGRQRWS